MSRVWVIVVETPIFGNDIFGPFTTREAATAAHATWKLKNDPHDGVRSRVQELRVPQ